jgi:hypothetical protein
LCHSRMKLNSVLTSQQYLNISIYIPTSLQYCV